MISNQILQETINGMKEVTGIDLCILDLSGRIVVTTMEITDALAQHAEEFADSMAESQVIDGFQYAASLSGYKCQPIISYLSTGSLQSSLYPVSPYMQSKDSVSASLQAFRPYMHSRSFQ